MQHLVSRWGGAAAGGVRYYILDNEPSIWHARTATCTPTGATMDEVRDRMRRLRARRSRRVDPAALVVGPEEWGWSGYLFSGYDQQYGAARNGWGEPARTAPRTAAGTTCPGCSTSCGSATGATGQRLLDVFTVHYYPQGGEFSDDVSQRDAAAAQPLDALALGPELRRRDLDQRRGCS